MPAALQKQELDTLHLACGPSGPPEGSKWVHLFNRGEGLVSLQGPLYGFLDYNAVQCAFNNYLR